MTQYRELTQFVRRAASRAVLVGVGVAIATYAAPALAQVTLDGTLGVREDLTGDRMVVRQSAGRVSGDNLFHSFGQFSPRSGQTVVFESSGIRNILARVTEAPSLIDGTIEANANLFLINPRGISFGPSARLNVNGSFLASTADSLIFPDRIEFSAADPGRTPLLSISAPIGLGYGAQPSNIEMAGNLGVGRGQSLILAGGSINMIGGIRRGNLSAPGGRVELVSVSEAGVVGLETESALSLNPQAVSSGNITLSNLALVDVAGEVDGSVFIYSRMLNLNGQSRIQAGIRDGTSLNAQAGNIEIHAEEVMLTDGSSIRNSVLSGIGSAGNILIRAGQVSLIGEEPGGAGEQTDPITSSGLFSRVEGVGQGGRIDVQAESVVAEGGAVITTTLVGQGVGRVGEIIVTADEVRFDGKGEQLRTSSTGERFIQSSGAFSAIRDSGRGQGGRITINAGVLRLTNGGVIVTNTLGEGQAGNVTVNANRVRIVGAGIGENSDFDSSGIYSQVGEDARSGQGGVIEIEADSIVLDDRGVITASTLGNGNGGRIDIRGGGSAGQQLAVRNGGQILAQTSSVGIGGGINIAEIDRIVVRGEGSSISASTSGAGSGGTITVEDADRVVVRDGAQISANAASSGRAGSLFVQADEVIVRGGSDSADSWQPSSLNFATEGTGDAGSLEIATDRLIVRDGAAVTARTTNAGDAGIIEVDDAELVEVSGTAPDGTASRLSFDTQGAGNAQAEGIDIETQRLRVRDGGQITIGSGISAENGESETPTQLGDPGDIVVEAESIALENDALVTAAASQGSGGNIRLRANNEIAVRRGSSITASTTGDGTGGNIIVVADNLLLENQGNLITDTQGGTGGAINIRVEDSVVLRHQSNISTFPPRIGDGGIIDIETPNGFVLAVLPEDSDIIASANRGDGGRAEATARRVVGFRRFQGVDTPESDFTADSELGLPGTVIIEAEEQELPEIPENVFAPRIAQGCETRGDRPQSEFVITGSAGLPTRPDSLDDSSVWEDLRPTEQTPPSNAASTPPDRPQPPAPIVEAQGWVMGSDGEVVLVAAAPSVTPQSAQSVTIACPPR